MGFNGWGEVRLGDVANVLSGYAFKSKDFCDKGIPIIKIKNIAPPYVTLDDVQYVSKELAEEKSRYKLKYNDVLISLTGSNVNQFTSAVGKVGRIKINKPMMLNQRVGKFEIIDESIYNLDFLYYLVSTEEMHYKLALNAGGAANQANISPSMIKNVNLPCPSISEQKAIANTLSCLDDKIELYNHINKNLEEMAQAIFKSWFVDFEPFLDSDFEDSELGSIPKGWKVVELGNFFPVITGKKNANVSSVTGRYPFFSCSQDVAWTDDYSFDGSAILVAGNGDFNVKWYKGKFEAYQRTYVLIPYNERLTGLLYSAIKFSLDKITSGHRGSVIKFITKGSIENFKIAMPLEVEDFEIVSNFESINSMIEFNNNQIRTLADIRELLLPKLMSGEIRVPIEEVQ